MGIGRIFWSHFQCDHLQPLCHNNSFLRVNNMMRRQIFVSVISTKANTPQFVSLESAALSRPHWIQKLHFLWNGKTKKKILGKCTFRHANDTQTRGGGTPRHALRGAVVTPLRLWGAVVTPMTIPPDTQWHTPKTRVRSKSWPGPEIKNMETLETLFLRAGFKVNFINSGTIYKLKLSSFSKN